jgi:uncharacterized protein (DUF2236 family)
VSLEIEVDADGTRRFRFRPQLIQPSADGIFAPDSVIRRVFGDAACLFGAGTALLLQLANPSIARAVHEHSDYANRPLDRLFGTLYATSAVVFGSRADAYRIADEIRDVHARVTGVGYRASDPELLCWVNATLLATAVQMYERIVSPLPSAHLDELADDARRVGEVFGCPLAAQPGTWSDFSSYWETSVASLTVTEPARLVAWSLLDRAGLPARQAWVPAVAISRAITAATLPPRIRDEYGLPWDRREQTTAKLALGAASAVMPRVPVRLRRLAPELLGSSAQPKHTPRT